jgi:tRNA threonylcarbamoyladenosine biosynthesis protein TsaB
MNILAIETATEGCATGLRTTGGVEIINLVDENRQHTEELTAGIQALLSEAGLKASDIDRVVVDHGPGLFTGLRVGIATAIALAQGVGAEIVGVSSLELLAHGAHDAGVRGTLVCAVDGRRGEVFVQTFTLEDGVSPKDEPRVDVPRTVVIEWATIAAPVTFTGDGVERYIADFSAVPGAKIHHEKVPSIHAALALGALRSSSATITPLYLREADAVANFTTRERSK